MTHRINLKDWESSGLAAGRITALCRVVRPQPFNGNVCVIQHRDQWLMAMTCDKLPIAHPPLISPFGAPCDVVLGREAWAFFDRYSTADEAQRGPVRPKDLNRYESATDDLGMALFAYWKRRVIYRADAPFSHIENPKWRSSATQPDWAIRHRLTTVSVRCVRVQDVSTEECDALCFGGDFPETIFPERFDRHDSVYSVPECYGRIFDRDNPRNPWADNPWVWVGEFNP